MLSATHPPTHIIRKQKGNIWLLYIMFYFNYICKVAKYEKTFLILWHGIIVMLPFVYPRQRKEKKTAHFWWYFYRNMETFDASAWKIKYISIQQPSFNHIFLFFSPLHFSKYKWNKETQSGISLCFLYEKVWLRNNNVLLYLEQVQSWCCFRINSEFLSLTFSFCWVRYVASKMRGFFKKRQKRENQPWLFFLFILSQYFSNKIFVLSVSLELFVARWTKFLVLTRFEMEKYVRNWNLLFCYWILDYNEF